MDIEPQQPVSGASDHPNRDRGIIHPPVYCHRPPPNKCYFYTVTIFLLSCILLLSLSLVFLSPRPLSLGISSCSLRSLQFDQTPSFRVLLAADFTIRNPNFGPVQLHSAMLTVLHGNATTGSADAFKGESKKAVVRRRRERMFAVEVAVAQSSQSGDGVLAEEERRRLREELNSGILQLKGVVRVTGDLVLLKKIVRKATGTSDCDIVIDLRSQRLLSFVCH